jgi:hypothetical protein
MEWLRQLLFGRQYLIRGVPYRKGVPDVPADVLREARRIRANELAKIVLGRARRLSADMAGVPMQACTEACLAIFILEIAEGRTILSPNPDEVKRAQAALEKVSNAPNPA